MLFAPQKTTPSQFRMHEYIELHCFKIHPTQITILVSESDFK